ncbi:MAG TPA: tetratricopeptide repeat protein [Opitutaceae bacterium]|jgi:tetratricopeptide (TPR) repeat protein|nr:tetratricopeptide repeat protein [Opitutaceae bacterium]
MPQSFDPSGTKVCRVSSRVLLGAVCVFTLAFYAWTARSQVRQMYDISDPAEAYYNLLVQGFRSGQLNLKQEAPPGLAKLADPYDPAANTVYREGAHLHDLSYYNGKLYLYYGVTPALVLFWPYVALTGHYLFHKQAVAIFCSLGFLASVALLCALRRRYFPEVSGLVVAACALALGWANCIPAMLQRPDVYEVAISCAYAMVMLALLGTWGALHDPSRRCWWLAAASLAYGLAVGARPNVLFGAVILLVPVVHAWNSAPEHDRPRWVPAGRLLAAAVVPISLIGSGLMFYNYLRFDSPFDFGMSYALAGVRERALPHMFSLQYFWFNFRVYFLQPLHWHGSFPFVDDITVPPAPAGQLGVANPFGVLTNLPLVWIAAAAPLAWQGRTPGEPSALRLFIAALAMLFGIFALTICLYTYADLRYQVDFVPVLVLLAVCGVLGLEHARVTKPGWRGGARWAWITILFFSVVVSLLVSTLRYAEEQFRAGVDHVALGRPQEAVVNFEQALRIKPDYAQAHDYLGCALLYNPDRLPDAIAQFQAALQLDPGLAEAHNNLGTALMDTPGHLPDAIAQFQAALRLDPDDESTHYNLGTAFRRVPGRLPEAMAQFEAAVRINPGDAEAHNNLGSILAQLGRLPEAIAQYEEALQLNPNFADARNNLELARKMMAQPAAGSQK